MRIEPEFRVPGHLLRRAFQAHDAIFARETDGFDITSPQLAILTAISLRPGVEMNPLGEIVGYDGATLNGLINRLIAKKLIRRTIGKEDRRRRHLHITASGQRLLATAMPHASRVSEILLAPLKESERQLFFGIMERIIVHAATSRPETDDAVA